MSLEIMIAGEWRKQGNNIYITKATDFRKEGTTYIYTNADEASSIYIDSFRPGAPIDHYNGLDNLTNMFNKNRSNVDLKEFKLIFSTTERVTLNNMFSNQNNLVKLNLEYFKVGLAAGYSGFLSNCSSLQEINLSNFFNIGSTDRMFDGCTLVETIDLSGIGFFIDKSYTHINMFRGCDNLKIVYVKDNESKNTLMSQATNTPSQVQFIIKGENNMRLNNKLNNVVKNRGGA